MYSEILNGEQMKVVDDGVINWVDYPYPASLTGVGMSPEMLGREGTHRPMENKRGNRLHRCTVVLDKDFVKERLTARFIQPLEIGKNEWLELCEAAYDEHAEGIDTARRQAMNDAEKRIADSLGISVDALRERLAALQSSETTTKVKK